MEDRRGEAGLINPVENRSDHYSPMPESAPLSTFTNNGINNCSISHTYYPQLGVDPGQFDGHEEDQYPPGHRFKPYDYELILYYLRKKIRNQPLPRNGIHEVELYRYNPVTLTANWKPYGEKEWYFFTPRDRKYPNGDRPRRAAEDGYWKATGADRHVTYANKVVGSKKTLVFYKGKPPGGEKTNWIMHEYIASDSGLIKRTDKVTRLDDWMLCRIYKRNRTSRKTRNNGQPEDEIEAQPLENNGNLLSQDNAVQAVVPTISGYNNPGSQLGYHDTSYGNSANHQNSQNELLARVSQDHAVPSVLTVSGNYNPGNQMGYLDMYGNSASAYPQNYQNGLARVSQDHALPSLPQSRDLPLEQCSYYVQKTILEYEISSFQLPASDNNELPSTSSDDGNDNHKPPAY